MFFWHVVCKSMNELRVHVMREFEKQNSGIRVFLKDLANCLVEVWVDFERGHWANVHVPVGKASFSEQQLLENFTALMEAINQARPSAIKGAYIRKVVLCATMGPGIKVDTGQSLALKLD
jgi:hypothetical protein